MEVLKAFALAPSGRAKKVTGFSYAELIEAMQADPDEAVVRFRTLLSDARYNVRYWACYAGAKSCGRKFVPALLEAFSDRSQTVQESVMWSLLEMEPNGRLLQPLLLGMRKSVLKWDEDAAFGPVRLLALMKDSDAAPYITSYLERSDINKADRARAETYLPYLTDGFDAVLSRIRDHSGHDRMYSLCLLASEVGTPDADVALEELIAAAPDERCQTDASEALDALRAARRHGPGPYLLGLKYYDRSGR